MSIFPKHTFQLSKKDNYVKTSDNTTYENFIKEQFETEGYTVWQYAKDKTQMDKNKNITLVAKKNKKILLIHCRDNMLDISVDELKLFQAQRDNFKIENPVFEKYDLTLHYRMSGFFLTEDAYAYVQENSADITYKVVKGVSENHWMDELRLQNAVA